MVKWTHRETCITFCHQTGKNTSTVGSSAFGYQHFFYCKFHLKFPSVRLFSLNVSAGSSISFFSFSFRMICLRAIISRQDVLDSSKDVVFFFSPAFAINIESQSCLGFNYTGCYHLGGWLSSSDSIKKQRLCNFLSTVFQINAVHVLIEINRPRAHLHEMTEVSSSLTVNCGMISFSNSLWIT